MGTLDDHYPTWSPNLLAASRTPSQRIPRIIATVYRLIGSRRMSRDEAGSSSNLQNSRSLRCVRRPGIANSRPWNPRQSATLTPPFRPSRRPAPASVIIICNSPNARETLSRLDPGRFSFPSESPLEIPPSFHIGGKLDFGEDVATGRIGKNVRMLLSRRRLEKK